MKKAELKLAIVAAARIAKDSELLLVGSQVVHAYDRRAPAEVLLSQECDLYPWNRPEAANLLDNELGRGSRFARQHGFYVDVVAPEIVNLPAGWQRRLKPFRIGKVTALCLDIHDVVVSKLAAGRLKDLEFVGAIIRLKIARTPTIQKRINDLPSEEDRQRVRTRLQIVLDDD